MKKNAMLKIAAILLVAVLLTTCAISTTFAKYVTDGNGDSAGARVAAWGVEFTTVNSDNHIFLKEKTRDGGFKLYSADEAIVAPGHSNEGTLAGVTATGAPEVAFKLIATVDVELTGWMIGETTEAYCPLTFTVGTDEVSIGGTDAQAIEDFELAIEKVIAKALVGAGSAAASDDAKKALAEKEYQAGDNVSGKINTITISWEWADNAANNEKDTALGNQAAADNAARVAISYTISAEQVIA